MAAAVVAAFLGLGLALEQGLVGRAEPLTDARGPAITQRRSGLRPRGRRRPGDGQPLGDCRHRPRHARWRRASSPTT